ncbi:uncharacterized protein K444DRAFT_542740 [Hyaloscypha bicolor E]|uniref:Integral membrane protein n=1 Tax=Hyaloscypha bicolor E TaxID=1095630 RepID=A0A2J6SPX8_9HELO|nr:uncharacterized protein K444DRAFT_542740 [Hyaloscypha bicolor E]PMD52780.1 hypothetical protein K444DRAFT_542740 [Hyaloscypha bicolor E]
MTRYALLLLFAGLVASSPLKNITFTVPDGTSTHGEPNLLCTPTQWTDIIFFFLGNYVAHAATAITLPGERWQVAVATAAGALFFPTSGVFRGIARITSFAVFGKNDIYTAARAGALCMVVRSRDWRPNAGDEAQYALCRIPSATKPYKSTYQF